MKGVTLAIYDFYCEKCDQNFEIIKSIKEYNGKEHCPTCQNLGQRIFSCGIEFLGSKIEDAEYNYGLGCITKSKRHREEIAKRKGMIELGNECPDKAHNYFEKSRNEKRKREWDEL
jgi:putative FmdB family regulatory protein